MTVAIDWDDTLVGYKKYGAPGEWLPGALALLRALRKAGFTIVIHSCRVNWDAGFDTIRAKLAESGFRQSSRFKIHTEPGKPLAVLYVDDRGYRFDTGEWTTNQIAFLVGLAEASAA